MAVVHLARFPAYRWSPTFTSILSMFRDGFLEFLGIVYNSFQRYTLIVFISRDVNGRIMLKEKKRKFYIILYGPFLPYRL